MMKSHTALAVVDAKQAMRVIRERAATSGIDPQRIGVLGFSAGGVVATGVATSKGGHSFGMAQPGLPLPKAVIASVWRSRACQATTGLNGLANGCRYRASWLEACSCSTKPPGLEA